MIKFTEKTDAKNIWGIYGSFGSLCGEAYIDGKGCKLCANGYEVEENTEVDEFGVARRTGFFKNTSDSPIIINGLSSKFLFDGGEYEVYTQYNGWQNESRGAWQPLVTGVSVSVESVRTSMGAAPVIALWNCRINRGMVFHLLPYYAWEMSVRRICNGDESTSISVDIGMNAKLLALPLAPNEKTELPEIVYYQFENKTDLDCYKLHNFCNKHFPRREMPIIYNTWLCRFDKLSYENVRNQIEPAARLGCEYFVIDAGWFGNGTDWTDSRGDWEENLTGALRGHMADISDEVRKNGMNFGFWLELESASPNSKIIKSAPDFYIAYNGCFFFNFNNAAACEYLIKSVCGLIEKYNARFLKLDFNQDMLEDEQNSAFLRYLSGYYSFIRRLKSEYPNIYIESCASGGMRTNLSLCRDFDSIWFSDNQSVNEGLRIYKDTVLRMPPQMIEKWAVIRSLPGIPDYNSDNPERIISTNDATWEFTESVHISTLKAFLLGGPVGFSCDLNSISQSTLDELFEFVKQYKQDRDFWKTAVCRILTDTDSMLVLQYGDIDFNKIVLAVICGKTQQRNVCVYPKTDICSEYRIGDEVVSGADISDKGLNIPLIGNNKTVFRIAEKVR